jgi:hypothetical protein
MYWKVVVVSDIVVSLKLLIELSDINPTMVRTYTFPATTFRRSSGASQPVQSPKIDRQSDLKASREIARTILSTPHSSALLLVGAVLPLSPLLTPDFSHHCISRLRDPVVCVSIFTEAKERAC